MTGTVTRVSFDGGFAFIMGEDNVQRFAHVKEFVNTWDFDSLKTGDRVEFEHLDYKRGPRAVKVRVTVAA